MLDPNDTYGLEKRTLVVGSAHGTPIDEIQAVKNKGATFVDTVCPLVEANFNWISTAQKNIVIYIGKPGHREYEATISRARKEHCFLVDLHQEDMDEIRDAILALNINLPIVLLRQTTIPGNDPDILRIHSLLHDALPQFQFTKNQGECYATQNRQDSLMRGIESYKPDVVLVLTASHSSNGMALVHTAESYGRVVVYAESPNELAELAEQHLESAKVILLVAAASVIDKLIDDAIKQLCSKAEHLGRTCNVQRPWLIERAREPILKAPQLP